MFVQSHSNEGITEGKISVNIRNGETIAFDSFHKGIQNGE
jgi:hypothetical protein